MIEKFESSERESIGKQIETDKLGKEAIENLASGMFRDTYFRIHNCGIFMGRRIVHRGNGQGGNVWFSESQGSGEQDAPDNPPLVGWSCNDVEGKDDEIYVNSDSFQKEGINPSVIYKLLGEYFPNASISEMKE